MKSSFYRSLSFVLLVVLLAVYARTLNDQLFFPRVGSAPLKPETIQERLKQSQEKLAADPNNLRALVDAGVLYFMMGPEHYTESLNAMNSAWRLGAFDVRIFYYGGILYENLSLFAEAEKQYERFLRHEPEDHEIRLRLARLLFRMGKWDDSVAHYQKFIQQNPHDATSLINLGLAYEKKHELKLAEQNKKGKSAAVSVEKDSDLGQMIHYLELAAKEQPSLPDKIYVTMAKGYFDQNDSTKSISACEQELKLYPNEKEALQLLSMNYERLNDKPKALEIYQKLLEIEPQNRIFKQKVKVLKQQLKITTKS